MNTAKFRVGQLVSSYGFGWFWVEAFCLVEGAYVYDLREELGSQTGKTPALLVPKVPEVYVRNILNSFDRLEHMSEFQVEVHTNIHMRKEDLLAQAFDRLDEEGVRPMHVSVETDVEVMKVKIRVLVVFDTDNGEVVRYQAL